ncbi:MAG TPA: DUF397 domain-containing protein [Streptosporangiaceae bacterium]
MASHNAASRAAGRKSSFSDHNGECVTVDIQEDHVLVWDSKDPQGPVLRFTPAEYVAFWKGVMNREFDPPAQWIKECDRTSAAEVRHA